MKTHHAHFYRRRARKSRRRQWLIGLFGVISLLLCWYTIVSLNKDTPASLNEAASLQATFAKDTQLAWPASGQAAIGSVEEGVLARSSNNEGPRPMASMAKVITALAIMEKQPFKLGETGQLYTLTSQDVANYQAEIARGGSAVPVTAGMTLTQYQAMQIMLIASSNNMADSLAERIFGSEEAYQAYAKAMLQRMGLTQTVVADASGFSSATTSTPSELVTIGIAALKNPIVAEIVAQPQAQIPGIGVIKNTNELLGANGVVGIKTGTTNSAGSCLLFAAHHVAANGQKVTIVGVIMGEPNAASLFDDSKSLLMSAQQGYGSAETPPVVDPPPTQRETIPRR